MAVDPVVLFFALGVAAGLARAELRLPAAIYEFVSTLLLLGIGLKGGVELAGRPIGALLPQVALVGSLGVVIPLVAFPVLRGLGRLPRPDAASLAAHYGSVSVGTYAVAVAWLNARAIPWEQHAPLFLVVLEVPAILVGILLARGVHAGTRWRPLLRELFLGKSVVLLVGGLLIGWAAGPQGISPIDKLFFDLFKGVLALFLLEMGLIAAGHVHGVLRHGPFLLAFGVLGPLCFGALGAAAGALLGLSPGGTTLLATLAGSASYIAAPAAMRTAVPEASPALSLAAALAITFPFNVLVGIPAYHGMAALLTGGP